MGFVKSDADPNLYYLRVGDEPLILVLYMLNFVALESVPSLKICEEAWTLVFQRTQKSFVEIPRSSCLIKIINYFNGDPKSKLREIK